MILYFRITMYARNAPRDRDLFFGRAIRMEASNKIPLEMCFRVQVLSALLWRHKQLCADAEGEKESSSYTESFYLP